MLHLEQSFITYTSHPYGTGAPGHPVTGSTSGFFPQSLASVVHPERKVLVIGPGFVFPTLCS